MPPITLALVDDHELVRLGLASWLGCQSKDIEVAAAVANVDELASGPGWSSSVVLLDLNLEASGTVEHNIARLIVSGSKVIVVSFDETPATVHRALQAGASGYLPKSATANEMVQAILEVSCGGTYMTQALAVAVLASPVTERPKLSPQELRTLQMYAGGMPLKSVAVRLRISEGAVKSYVDRIREKYQKLGREAPTKVDLYQRAVEDGFLTAVPAAR